MRGRCRIRNRFRRQLDTGVQPEILHCAWIDGATGPAVGARFKATNRVNPDGPKQNNTPVVMVADPGREFASSRTVPLAGTVLWRYLLESNGDRTRLTESYTVVKPVTRIGWSLIRRVFGRNDRRDDLRRGITETLRRVSAAAESNQRAVDFRIADPQAG